MVQLNWIIVHFIVIVKKDNKIVVPSKFNINLNSDELKFVKKEINHLLQFSP